MPDIAEALQHEGNVTQEVIPPAISGAEITRLSMYKADALRELASGYQTLGSDIASGVSSALKGIGAGNSDDMARQGALAGRSAVTRDPNGDIQVQPPTGELFGLGGKQYANAVADGTQQQITTNLQSDLQRFAADNSGNPEAFKAAAAGYFSGHTGGLGAGTAGQIALLDARDYADQLYNHMRNGKASSDIGSASSALQGTIKSTQADLISLAQGGMAGSDEFAKTLGRQSDAYNSLTNNPSFGYSADQASVDRKNNALNVTAATIQGSMATAFKSGGINAAKAIIPSIDDHPGATDADKAQLHVWADAYAKTLEASNSTDIAANKAAFDAWQTAGEKDPRNRAPLDVLQGLQNKAFQLGDSDTSGRAAIAIATHNYAGATISLSPSQHDAINGVTRAPGPPLAVRGTAALTTGWTPGPNDTRADKNFNPGNIAFGDWARAHGATGAAGTDTGHGVAVFRSPQDGFNAMAALARAKYDAGKTTADQLIAGHGGWTPGNHEAAANVARGMGITPYADLLLNSPTRMAAFQKALATQEGAPKHVAALGGASVPQGEQAAVKSDALPGAPSMTWEDLKNNPYASAAYAHTLAADETTRTRTGEALLESSTRGLQNGVMPSQQTMVQIEQLAADNPKLAEKYDKYAVELGARQPQTTVGGGAGSQPFIDQLRAQAMATPDILQRQIVEKKQELRDASQKLLDSNPVAAAQNGRWIGRAPVPLDPTQPQSIPQHFADNAGVVDAIASREPGFDKSVVFKNEVGRFGAAMAGPAPVVNAILQSIASLPPDKQTATLETTGVKEAILGAANSPDPQKAQVAYDFMNSIYQQEPQTFDGKFGAGALVKLRAWQDIDQFKSPEMRAKDIAKAGDASDVRGRQDLVEQSNKDTERMTASDAVNRVAPHLFSFFNDNTPVSDNSALTNAVILDDWRRARAAGFSESGSASFAENYADERTRIKWGESPANGDRVMPYAPERSPAYPMVNGSHDYIGEQLADFVAKAGHPGVDAHLVATNMPGADTRAEMASGKPPGYSVVVPVDGRYTLLPGRFYADPQAPQAQATSGFKLLPRRPVSIAEGMMTGGVP